MRRLGWVTLGLGGVGAAGVSFVFTEAVLAQGLTPLIVQPLLAGVIALLALFTAVAGWQVRQFRRGERTRMTALRAASVVVWAQAGALMGAVILGWMLAQVGVGVAHWDSFFGAHNTWGAGVCALAGLAWLGAGKLAEAWCVAGDDDSGRGGPGGGGGAGYPSPDVPPGFEGGAAKVQP